MIYSLSMQMLGRSLSIRKFAADGELPPSVLPKKNTPMYAVAFDLDTEILRQTYGDPANNAYGEIKRFLLNRGFEWQQGSVYFGNAERINAVTCVIVINEMSRALPWFAASVRDIRMLRIEENNDLTPALQLGA
jgi:virulence-associated protein VapD